MSARAHAVKVGLRRGWAEFVQGLRSPQDLGFYLFTGGGAFLYLFLNRDNQIEGTSLFMPQVALPSLLGAALVIGVVIGPAFTLAMEREDGTLLRLKAIPHGITGYVSGQILFQSLNLIPGLGVVLIPSLIFFDDLMQRGVSGWILVVLVILLALVATLPIGMIVGSLAKNTQAVATWGMTPVMGLASISGIFFPIQALWDWVQVAVQIFPMYWIGLGMRSAFLPEAAAAMEIGGSWRTLETVAVLGAWAVIGMVVAPIVLRRMSRRQSGSAVEEARDAALQWNR